MRAASPRLAGGAPAGPGSFARRNILSPGRFRNRSFPDKTVKIVDMNVISSMASKAIDNRWILNHTEKSSIASNFPRILK